MFSPYDDKSAIARAVREGRHRDVIGGLWEQLGQLQLDFLEAQGLQPGHRLLDIGCGSLRLGTLAVEYLEAGNYFGTDINESLIEAGYEAEIADKSRLPRQNLVVDDSFDFTGIPAQMDYAIACSVFTHLPLNHLRRALIQLRARFPGIRAVFFTVFVAPSLEESVRPVEQAGGIATHDTRDPYHYTTEEILFMTSQCGYSARIVDWKHPRNQQMVIAVPSD